MSYPLPADVRLGVQYGPTGTEYTGTMVYGFASRMTVTLTAERMSISERKRKLEQVVSTPLQDGISKSTAKNAYVRTYPMQYRVSTPPDEVWIRTSKEII